MTLTSKMATLTFRIKPILKEALRTAASQEHRSLSNMVEMLILAIGMGSTFGKWVNC